ncbi:MAG: ATP-binding cassette domain-containing protein [Gemmatimonadales bacterium]|nr:ATP-binding cassette domain-containing protein [Gemmatimonadales bacterium]
MTPVLELAGIGKRYGSVQALDGADFVLAPGEVHALLGENGAGKSTLMQVAFGLVEPDTGSIRIRGEAVRLAGPRDAKARGLGMVHQHFTSVPAMTVRENLWLAAGRVRHPAGSPPAPGSVSDRLDGTRTRLWQGLDPSVRAEDLGVGAKQRLEILQALATGASVLLLDEPTGLLTQDETTELLQLLRAFADRGGAVVLITHKLAEALAVADRVTVLRRGKTVWSGTAAAQNATTLAAAMLGAGTDRSEQPQAPGPAGDVVVQVSGLVVRAGEIVGVAAVEGNGERELLRTIAGVEARASDGLVASPVVFIPGDRTTEGLIPGFSLTENLVLGQLDRWSRGGWINWRGAADRTGRLLGEHDVRAPGAGALARTLSGGNQQKLILARALDLAPRVVVAENPTRGLDLQATAAVHARLRSAAAGGAGVLVYSADLDEILELASRVVVVHRGVVLPVPQGASRAELGRLMLQGAQ